MNHLFPHKHPQDLATLQLVLDSILDIMEKYSDRIPREAMVHLLGGVYHHATAASYLRDKPLSGLQEGVPGEGVPGEGKLPL
jgi:hypothetical protein